LVEPEAGNLLPSRLSEPLGKNVEVRGIPHLAKNERDVGHGGFRIQVQHFLKRR
jgi:hypothetical protein